MLGGSGAIKVAKWSPETATSVADCGQVGSLVSAERCGFASLDC